MKKTKEKEELGLTSFKSMLKGFAVSGVILLYAGLADIIANLLF